MPARVFGSRLTKGLRPTAKTIERKQRAGRSILKTISPHRLHRKSWWQVPVQRHPMVVTRDLGHRAQLLPPE